MRLKRGMVGVALLGCALLPGCKKDSQVRQFLRADLQPYLDSLAYQLCYVKHAAAPDKPGRIICPGPPEGYKPPPPNGNP